MQREGGATRGLTWVNKRFCWILRYTDSSGAQRQKRFKGGGGGDCKEEARVQAIEWRDKQEEERNSPALEYSTEE